MARVTKDCPACGDRQPVQLTLHPVGTPEAPSKDVRWEAVCVTCGHVHAPDAAFAVTDGRAWGKSVRGAHGSLLDADGKIREA